MTSQLKLILSSLVISATVCGVLLVNYSLSSTNISQYEQSRFLSDTTRVANSAGLALNRMAEYTKHITDSADIRSAVLSNQYSALLDLGHTNQQLPFEFAIYDAADNTVYRKDVTPESGSYYELENLILNQIKSSSNRLSINTYEGKTALINHVGYRINGDLKAILFVILPLDKDFLSLLKNQVGADIQLTIGAFNLTTASHSRAADGSIEWPFATKSGGQMVFWLPNQNQKITGFSFVAVIIAITLLFILVIIIFLVSKQEADQLSELTRLISESNSLAGLLDDLSGSRASGQVEQLKQKLMPLLSGQMTSNKQVKASLKKLQKSFDILDIENKELKSERDSAVSAPRTTSEFLSRMGDEITTPMKTLTSMLHLLSEYNLAEEPKELLTIARRASGTLINNLNNILDFSKLDAGLLKLYKNDFDINKLFEEIDTEYKQHAKSKGLNFTSSISADTPPIIFNDVKRVKQIIRNLTGNAIRFTKDGTVNVSTKIALEGAEQFLKISIKDSGVGIPEEAQAGLFDSLETKTKLTNSSFTGRLRLIVSKKLAESMGGTIGVESEPNEGTEFWFTVSLNK